MSIRKRLCKRCAGKVRDARALKTLPKISTAFENCELGCSRLMQSNMSWSSRLAAPEAEARQCVASRVEIR